MNHEGMIQSDVIKAARRRIRDLGWKQAALAMLDHEPLLASCIAVRWEGIRKMLEALGLPQEQVKAILCHILMLLVEGMYVKDQAKDKLLAEFLPATSDGGGGDHG